MTSLSVTLFYDNMGKVPSMESSKHLPSKSNSFVEGTQKLLEKANKNSNRNENSLSAM